MNTASKVTTIAFMLIIAMTVPALGDVVGTFETHILFSPQTTVSEVALAWFDVQNSLDTTAVVSGMSATLHTHFGIAGIEDVLLSMNASIGFFTVNTTLAFARFDSASLFPYYNSLHFLLKQVEMSLNVAGVTLTNTAQFQDTAAFVSQTTAYVFGDSIRLQGQTPSGVGVIASAGICLREQSTGIKKHLGLVRFTANSDCYDEPKPDMLFDFATVTISNLPLATNLTGSTRINCDATTACSLVQTISFVAQPIPITVGLTFSDVTNLTFSGSTITLQSESATLVMAISPVGTISFVTITIFPSLVPDPLTARLSATIVPGTGFSSGVVSLSILPPSGVGLGLTFTFGGGPPAKLTNVRGALSIPGQLLSIRTLTSFTPKGLEFAELFLTVSF